MILRVELTVSVCSGMIAVRYTITVAAVPQNSSGDILCPQIFCGSGVDDMRHVTYSELFQLCTLIVSIINLVILITR